MREPQRPCEKSRRDPAMETYGNKTMKQSKEILPPIAGHRKEFALRDRPFPHEIKIFEGQFCHVKDENERSSLMPEEPDLSTRS